MKEAKEARREKESSKHMENIPSQGIIKEQVSSNIETGVRPGEPITTSAGKTRPLIGLFYFTYCLLIGCELQLE